MNSVLKAENDFEVEAKRAIVTHDLEKLANSMLSDINIENITNIHYGAKKICQQAVPWKDNIFWNELPNPTTYHKQKLINNLKSTKQIESHCLPFYKATEHRQSSLQKSQIIPAQMQISNNKLSRKFFEKWKMYTKNKKDHKNRLNEKIEQKEKLDNFFKMLKKCQNKKLRQNTCKTPIKMQFKSENLNSIAVENSTETTELQSESKIKNKTFEDACYKHRFKAQQDIIQIQKEKLIKQEKVIQELRLGKLSKEIDESLKETQKEIHETLTKCSVKVKCKVKPTQMDNVENDLVKFHINSSKAPKIVQQMEKRALEREQKRQMILEKKRLLDQQKKEAREMEIERKKALDEKERKRNLREIMERRKKEMEIQQHIQIRKQKFLEGCMKADRFYRRKLIKLAFKGFFRLMEIKENNIVKSEEFYEMSLKRKGWKKWSRFMQEIDLAKINKVELLYHFKLKKKMLKLWINAHTISIQHTQVAEDLYEMRLQSKMFIHWHRYTCTQYVMQNKNLQNAHKHYCRRILFHYFYQWKLLPAVMQMEKAKEEKKRKWREKVWEILPDYKPQVED